MLTPRVLPALMLLGTSIATGAATAQDHHPAGHDMAGMSGMAIAAPAAPAKDYDDPGGPGNGGNASSCEPGDVPASISGFTFSPEQLTVQAGQTVCWSWAGSFSHNVTGDSGTWGSGSPASSGHYRYLFATAGTFGYYCQVHGSLTTGMRGSVVVEGSTGGGGGDGGDPGSGPGTLQLSATDYPVAENAGPVTITVQRVGGSDGKATVKYAAAPGNAKPGKDYLPRAGVLSWPAGDHEPRSFTINLKNDGVAEPDETFAVKLSKPTGAGLGTSSATVTIHDDDGGGCPTTPAPTALKAAGRSASEIRLTWSDQTGSGLAVHVERRGEAGDFRQVATVPAGVSSFVDTGLPAEATFQYRLRAVGLAGTSPYSEIAAGATDGLAGGCADGALCLADGRFEATMLWKREGAGATPEAVHPAIAASLSEAPRSGLFSFAPDGDLQVLVNVVNGCGVNGHYWLSLAAATDVEFTVRVRDTQSGRTWVHFNPAGTAPAAVRDVDALATCP
ncbi:MAG TPA: Calx-beta domain-containing protein [Thermoanaerobaculia bacterium]|jgi:plastocyanin|nr:Calx-beta domain-containing protein [Thermoanaerobaculia bacterium]